MTITALIVRTSNRALGKEYTAEEAVNIPGDQELDYMQLREQSIGIINRTHHTFIDPQDFGWYVDVKFRLAQ